MKIDIIYFSACGNSKNIAKQLYDIVDLRNDVTIADVTYATEIDISGELLVVVAPVYNDSLASPMLKLLELSHLNFKHYAVIATYGGVTFKNALFGAMRILDNKGLSCSALASIATNHSYLTQESDVPDKTKILNKFIESTFNNVSKNKTVNIKPNNSYAIIKKSIEKNHDKLIQQPTRDLDKCVKCGVCQTVCPAIASCINCMACVKNCPKKAISFKLKKLPTIGIKAMNIISREYKIYS